MRFSTILLLVLVGTQSGLSTSVNSQAPDRYVSTAGRDGNEGSLSRPWRTLQYAALRVRPGMTVHVAPGDYGGAISTLISGSANARIRFVSDVKWAARIRSRGAHSVWTNRGDYADIVGFDISGDGFGGILNWGSAVRIIANHVHDIPAPGCPGDGGSGIANANYDGGDDDIIANVVHDVGDLKTVCARVHGIYHSNIRGRVINNVSYRNQGFGIHLWHAAAHVTVANNLVFNNHFGGILIGAGDAPHRDDPAFPADRIAVVNNIVVYNLNSGGIEEMGVTGRHNRYINNLVFRNQAGNWRLQTGSQSGTLEADPQFIDYKPDGSGNYHLRPTSIAIGKGWCLNGPGSDIDGRPRPTGGTCDIGPYESQTIGRAIWPPPLDQ